MKYTSITIPELISKLKQLPDQHKKYTIRLDEQPVKKPGLLHKLKSWWSSINSRSKSSQEQTQDIISSILKMIDVKPGAVSTEQTEQLTGVVAQLIDLPPTHQQQVMQNVQTQMLEKDTPNTPEERVTEIIDTIKQSVETTQHVEPSVVIVDEQMNPIAPKTVTKPAGETFFDDKHDIFHIFETVRRENRWLDCDIIDISDKHGALACVAQSLEPGKYRIVINSGTYRFNNVKNNQMMLALHVAECVFRCVLEFTGTRYTLKTLDTLLDQFHDRFVGEFEETVK